MNLIRLIAIAVLLVLAGCANVAKVSSGDVALDGGRISLTLDGAWNQVNLPGRTKPVLWTQDGITIDALEFWVGIKDGEELVKTPSDKRPIAFKRSMEPHEIVALFEALYGRSGSTFTLNKLAPVEFLGGTGFRFEYTVVRKVDDVRATGVAWATVRNGELFAMTFAAPRLGFFPKHLAKVEQVARSARLKS